MAKHNAQRTEEFFEKLTESLASDNFSQEEIDSFYGNNVVIEERLLIYKVGPLIAGHEEIRDVRSPVCVDGIVIAPRSLKAVMITVPTVFEPSGEKDIKISPGQAGKQTPLYSHVDDYTWFYNEPSLYLRVERGQTMLPCIKTHNGKEYKLPDPIENLVLQLGRETASIGRLMIDLANLPNLASHYLDSLKDDYIKTVASVFIQRRKKTQNLMESAGSLALAGKLNKAEEEKLGFYALLAETYLSEMDFLAEQIKNGQPMMLIAAFASVFRQVGREQVSALTEIINGLTTIVKELPRAKLTKENLSSVEKRLVNVLGKPFGFADAKRDNRPVWFKDLQILFINSLDKKLQPKKIEPETGFLRWLRSRVLDLMLR